MQVNFVYFFLFFNSRRLGGWIKQNILPTVTDIGHKLKDVPGIGGIANSIGDASQSLQNNDWKGAISHGWDAGKQIGTALAAAGLKAVKRGKAAVGDAVMRKRIRTC